MKKKWLLITSCLLVVILVTGIGISIHKSTDERELKRILEDDDTSFVTLQEARCSAKEVVEKGRNGEFRNMTFMEFEPVITEEDSISAITLSTPSAEFSLESIDEQVEVLQKFFGDKLDQNHIIDSYDRTGLDILKEKVKGGNYNSESCYLFYIKDDYYGHVDTGIHNLWIDTGMKGVTPSGEGNTIKEYYAAATDGSLEDVYMTATGEISVQEAICDVEKYFNEDFPIAMNGVVQYRVRNVWIIDKGNGQYGFEFGIRKVYGGVPLEYVYPGTLAYGADDNIDMIGAYMDGKGNIPYFNALSLNLEVKVNETYETILSPEVAIEYVSQKVGNETTYEITGMELSYVSKELNGDATISSMPVWMIFAENQTTEQETRFYVDVVTGQVSVRVM